MQLRQERLALEEALADEQPDPAQRAAVSVAANDVAEVVAKWTGVPVTNIYTEDAEKLLHLEAALHERLVGQDEAVVAVADAIRRSRSGLADPPPADWVLPLPRTNRRRQDGAGQEPRGLSLRRRGTRCCASICRSTWRGTTSPGCSVRRRATWATTAAVS